MPAQKKATKDRDCLREVEGWLELGDTAEALSTLGHVSAQGASTIEALRARYSAFAASEQWNYALLVSEVAMDIFPSAAEVWLWRAHAIRVITRSASEARDALSPAGEKFPEDPIILLNLALYESELGASERAAGWLSKTRQAAMASDCTEAVRRLVDQDDHLRQLWDSIESSPS